MEQTKEAVQELCSLCSAMTGHQENLAREVMDRIGAKWPLYVLCVLASAGKEPLRFSSLLEKLEGISNKILTQTLKQLERDGLVFRSAQYNQVPPRAEYVLTPLGREMVKAAVPLWKWIIGSIEYFEAARKSPPQSVLLIAWFFTSVIG